MVKKAKWHHNLKKHVLEVSMRKEIITLEEGLLLVTGLLFGWLAGVGMPIMLLLIPTGLLAVFILDLYYRDAMMPKIKKLYEEHLKFMKK